MNKYLFHIKNFVFLINIIVLIYFSSNSSSIDGSAPINFLLYVILTLFLIIGELGRFKKANLLNSLKYDISFLAVGISTLLITIRNFIDPNFFYQMGGNVRFLFFNNNLIYINIMYICLIIYFTINKVKS